MTAVRTNDVVLLLAVGRVADPYRRRALVAGQRQLPRVDNEEAHALLKRQSTPDYDI